MKFFSPGLEVVLGGLSSFVLKDYSVLMYRREETRYMGTESNFSVQTPLQPSPYPQITCLYSSLQLGQDKEDTCVPLADSCCCMAETNTTL